ncbi:MAG: YaaA family protein [Campylobacterales bacterium]|nr:YaaA family protein [Campylobacterales bacterium]
MKILLAPSETKVMGGEGEFDTAKLFFNALHPKQNELITLYNETVLHASDETLSKMLGINKLDEIAHYRHDICKQPVLKAIERYSGVAFDYLDYASLDTTAQSYIDENVILFSNLLGILKANDTIPEYKLKQGQSIGEVKTDKFYQEAITQILESYLQNEELLDIRAGYYDKFYKPKSPYTTLKFIKEGKVVSHWVKAYRGKVLREIARHQVDCLENFMKLEIENLIIDEITTIKNKTQIVYTITGE